MLQCIPSCDLRILYWLRCDREATAAGGDGRSRKKVELEGAVKSEAHKLKRIVEAQMELTGVVLSGVNMKVRKNFTV